MSAECGTYAGYQQHRRERTGPCGICYQAHADYMRDYRRRTGLTRTVGVPVHVVKAAIRQVSPGTAKALRQALDGAT